MSYVAPRQPGPRRDDAARINDQPAFVLYGRLYIAIGAILSSAIFASA